MTIALSSAAIIALTLLSGCLIPGGSAACDTAADGCLITANDLEGTWCNQGAEQTCLTVIQPYSYSTDAHTTNTRYILTVGLCLEQGTLTGGLEFSPDTASRVCLPGFGHGLWSAGGHFSSHGLYLSTVNQSEDGTTATTVSADDLDLSYVR